MVARAAEAAPAVPARDVLAFSAVLCVVNVVPSPGAARGPCPWPDALPGSTPAILRTCAQLSDSCAKAVAPAGGKDAHPLPRSAGRT
ncbi:hypothetical protein GCM10009599_01310 [Luteococcus peritonei]